MNSKPPMLPKRQASAPKRYQNSQPHTFTTLEEYYKIQYYEIIDRAVTSLSERITNKEIPVLRAIETLLQCAWKGHAQSANDVDLVYSHYGDDLDRSQLEAQLQALKMCLVFQLSQYRLPKSLIMGT